MTVMPTRRFFALLFAPIVCVAQEGAAPHESFRGPSGVTAHRVRLEGSAFPEQQWAAIRATQTTCVEKMNTPVQLPPPGTALLKVVSDEYYTETHFIDFKKTTSTFINAQCELDSKTTESIEVKHAFGNCQLNPRKKTAIGQCAKSYPGAPVPTTEKGSGNRRSLGMDREQSCVRYQWELGRLQQTVCIQAADEPWRSLIVRGQADLAGLWLSNRIQQTAPALTTSIDLKATKVEKNIKVSQELLDIAGSQGYKIVEIRLR